MITMTSTRSLRTTIVLAVTVVVGLVLAGCGAVGVPAAGDAADRGGPSSSGPDPTAGGASSTLPDEGRPPATGLDPGLVAAVDQASAAAAADGHTLVINSGYRTPERQQELLAEAVEKHGSLEVASRWVFTPEKSMHVQGLAVDVGDGPAADWLDANGALWGLCRTLDWEWWHFEWRARWQQDQACPGPVDEPADAPGI